MQYSHTDIEAIRRANNMTIRFVFRDLDIEGAIKYDELIGFYFYRYLR